MCGGEGWVWGPPSLATPPYRFPVRSPDSAVPRHPTTPDPARGPDPSLRIMETGSELSKTVATFIVQKILLDETGLAYICATAERFYAVSTVLGNLVGSR